jgi:hypothetical protein
MSKKDACLWLMESYVSICWYNFVLLQVGLLKMDFILPFKVGDLVESRSFTPGFRGAWFRSKVNLVIWQSCVFVYLSLFLVLSLLVHSLKFSPVWNFMCYSYEFTVNMLLTVNSWIVWGCIAAIGLRIVLYRNLWQTTLHFTHIFSTRNKIHWLS